MPADISARYHMRPEPGRDHRPSEKLLKPPATRCSSMTTTPITLGTSDSTGDIYGGS